MKLNNDIVIDRLKKAYGGEYDLSEVNYLNKNSNITLICRTHGPFEGRLSTLISRKQRCKQCKIDEKLEEYKKFLIVNLPHIEFLDGQTYVNSKTKMSFQCSFHGEFINTWNVITSKNKGGCQKCGNITNRQKRTKSLGDVLRDINKAHDGKVTLLNPEEYINAHSRLKFKCDIDEHSYWEARVYSVGQGQGCPKCAGKNITTDEFKATLKEIHGTSLRLVEGEVYKSRKIKHRFKCDIEDHPVFMSAPSNVIFQKSGCPECKKIKLRAAFSFSTDEVYAKIKQKHGSNIIPLPNQVYENQLTRWEFTCGDSSHKNWTTNIGTVLNSEYKYGCRECFGETTVISVQEIQDELQKKFGDKISFVSIKNEKQISKQTRVKVLCNKHNVEYSEKLINILKSKGCEECSLEERSAKRRTGTKTLIKQIFEVHREFIKVVNPEDYVNTDTKLEFNCHKEKHGVFSSTSHSIISGQGCPICKMSKGERKILFWLRDNKVVLNSQHRVKKHKGKGHFIFDFYLPELDIVIEYDGRQHSMPVEVWGGEKALKEIKKIDSLKDEYAKLKGWRMIRIPYTDFDNLEGLLSSILKF